MEEVPIQSLKVEKVAVFKLQGTFYESMDEVEQEVRRIVIREFLIAEGVGDDKIAELMSKHWRRIQLQVEKAFSGIG